MADRSIVFALAVPPLILLTLFAQFVRFHRYPLLAPEILLIAALLVPIGLGFAVVARLRPTTLEPLLMSVLTFAFLYPQLSDYLPTAGLMSALPLDSPVVLMVVQVAGLFLPVAALAWLLRPNLGLVLTTVFGVVLVSTLALPTPTVEGGVLIDRPIPPADSKLPPLIHIILDEHIGVEGVPTEVAGGSAALEAIRATYAEASGFALYGRAYSWFAETQYSISTLMNGEAALAADRLVQGDISRGHIILENRWLELLSEQGYRIRVYENVWLDFCRRPSELIDYCYMYPSSWRSINPLQNVAIPIMDKMHAILKSWLSMFFALADDNAPPYLGSISSMHALSDFESDFFSNPTGTAYVVHLLMPHFAYIYDKDCHIRRGVDTWLNVSNFATDHYNTPRGRQQRYRLYLEQVACTAARLAAFFERMKVSDLFEEAIIIVHGDHGSRIATANFRFISPDDLTEQDMVDHFSTLFAAKAPHVAPGYHSDLRSIQSLFAEMFLGQDAAPRADDSVFMRMMGEEGNLFLPRSMVQFGNSPSLSSSRQNQ